jgi:hypothetical protein
LNASTKIHPLEESAHRTTPVCTYKTLPIFALYSLIHLCNLRDDVELRGKPVVMDLKESGLRSAGLRMLGDR